MSPSIPAYLDPASGSIAWQVAISSILAIAAACRLYWQKLKSLLRLGGGNESAKANEVSHPGESE
jgi:hypothetical protein